MFMQACRVFTAAAIVATASTLLVAPAAHAQTPSSDVRLLEFRPDGLQGRLSFAGFTAGKVLHTADGGQVFGFDLDQHGADGLLGSAKTVSPQGKVVASVETFDQATATITKVIRATRSMDDWVTAGIVASDVGLILHEHVVNNHNIRSFHLLNPVTGNMFTGTWTPPNGSNFLLQQVASNQTTAADAVLGYTLTGSPLLFSSDIAANTFGPVFPLDPNHFGGGDQPQLAMDEVHNRAVLATSPDGGAVGGQVPLIAMIDLATGTIDQFNGVLIGIFHSGYVNGLAVDAATGIACTSTELDADVEFYDLAHKTGFAVGLPGANGNQSFTGEAIVSDPIHKLFLVAQPNGSVGPPGGSVIDVFNERGRLVKSITGFKAFGVTPGLAVNPAKRMGFIDGPTPDALTRFSY